MSDLDLTHVDRIVADLGTKPQHVIGILQAIQEEYLYLPQDALKRVCEISDITPARIAGVSTFYSEFRHKPIGDMVIHVCHGTACHVKGAPLITDAYHRFLGIPEGDDTDPERKFTVQKVACLGCCSLAVAVRIQDTIYGHVTPDSVGRTIADALALAKAGAGERKAGQLDKDAEEGEIRICLDSCCLARGCGKVHDALLKAIDGTGVRVVPKRTSCVVVCNETPLLEVAVPGKPIMRYAQVRPEDVKSIVLKHFRPSSIARKIKVAVTSALENALTDDAWEPVTRYAVTMREPRITAFVGPQRHIAMEDYGEMDPTDLDQYVARDGFRALEKILEESKPEEVIETITSSGLRGRGGGGFPTGLKWSRVRAEKSETKYIVANGDEGDPGAFMDRMLLESFPYRVIEGMAIAAYAVGASSGHLYIRSEYPFALKRMSEAIGRCRERGSLGNDVLGAGWAFDLSIMRGAGAFVCGEETALLASIEGERGMPRLRPPYPAQKGLWKKPTLVNNVETYSLVPWIMRNGAEAFAALGTDGSKGTKVFALAGKTVRGGLVEVQMGVTIREIVEEIGGGIAEDGKFKAVLVGGPSGGCLPARLADTPIDYDALTQAGAMMGSGGLVVLDNHDCMVDIARYFLEFTQDQSCGKCTFCRIGTKRMLEILTRLCGGEGRNGDIEELERLAGQIKGGSLCGLGKTAPNPVLTTIRYFRDEYEAHIAGRCPAAHCRSLIRYSVTDRCIGCTKCAQQCPSDAIEQRPYERHYIDPAKCVACGACKSICPAEAIEVE